MFGVTGNLGSFLLNKILSEAGIWAKAEPHIFVVLHLDAMYSLPTDDIYYKF